MNLASFGKSLVINELKQRLEQISRTKNTLLLIGKKGGSIELCARFLHVAGSPWLGINEYEKLATAPLELLEQAREGMLFINEVSDLNKISLTPQLVGDIQFNNVHFRYGTRTVVFEGLNLLIKKGQSTAIVGESGSGKSTLLSLLQNLYPLKEGNITIGGIDIQQISNDSIRKIVSTVPQNIDLFAGTVIENIALGDFEPDMQRILGLSQMLGINEFIEKLPNTYGSILSEQGINLSGGQRQRLAIARALYRMPEILILDEATSSLDPASEQKVQDVLSFFKQQGKTIIIIAHRLSTIKNCDTIAVLQNGKLLELGNHTELISKEGKYKEMWEYNKF